MPITMLSRVCVPMDSLNETLMMTYRLWLSVCGLSIETKVFTDGLKGCLMAPINGKH
ncbi:hypothetical protein PssvBMR2_gp01 [Pseudomonas phage MR2]|uniref:Uncharacterized protein n=1 Tax=Pseudomonas phage MR2 TaxID=2711170 RepID=A0A6M3T8V0_9CAUD|nr:hypothetical protein PssvBMR2_gp01 [Pseudomonas phage MR2]